jgi:PAS domain S-box-containing protein
VENARLYESEHRSREAAELSAERMARLQAATAALSEAVSPSQVAEAVITQGLAALGAQAGAVAMRWGEGEALELIHASGGPSESRGDRWRELQRPLADAVQSGNCIFIESPEDLQAMYPRLVVAESGVESGALAVIPLQVHGAAIGATAWSFSGPHFFSDNVRAFMQALAHQCAQALERSRLYQSAQGSRDRVFQLQQITAAFSQARTPEQVASVAVSLAREAIGADSGALMMLTENASDLEPVGTAGIHGTVVDRFRRISLAGTTPAARAAQTRQPIFVESRSDLARYPGMTSPLVECGGSWLVMPVVVENDHVIGTLGFGFRRWRRFADDDRFFLLMVADVCAQAMERSRLYDAERKARSDAEAGRRRAAFLAEASKRLASSLDFEGTLERVAHLAVPEIADWCIVRAATEGGCAGMAVAHREPEKVAGVHEYLRRFPPHPSTCDVLKTGTSVLYESISDEQIAASAPDPEQQALVRALGCASSMVVPLMVDRRHFGAISLVSGNPEHRYNRGDLEMAEELARRAGVAIENACLYEQARHADEELRVRAQHEIAVAELSRRALLDSPSTLMGACVDMVAELCRVECALLAEFSHNEGRCRIRAAKGCETASWPTFPHGIHALVSEVVQRGELVMVEDVRTESRFAADPLLVEHGLASAVAAPIPGQAHPWGALLALAARPRAFTPDERHFLARIASVLGWSIERECAQAALRASEDRLSGIVGSAMDAIITVDAAGRIALFNQAAEKMLRCRAEQVLGLRIEPFIPLRLASGEDRESRSARERGMRRLLTARRANGEEFPAEISMARVVAGGEELYTIVLRDVTERKRAEENRTRLQREAEQAMRAREEMIAIASHDMRSPLNALRLQLDIMRRAAHRPDAVITREWVVSSAEKATENIDRVVDLMDDLLDSSRAADGEVEIHLERVDLAMVVQEVVSRHREQLSEAGCMPVLHADEPTVGRWDRMRLEQVIGNMLSNAIKYGAGKPVTISVESDKETATLTIQDQGIGISREDQKRIFERFFRASTAAHARKGFGLGLWIVGRIVKTLGGRIAVDSAPGAGTTFTISLPRAGPPVQGSGVRH